MPNNPWQYFKKLFKAAEESSASNPFLHEIITRTPEEQVDFTRWKGLAVRKRLSDWVFNQYGQFLLNPVHIDETIDFLNTPSSKGFAIHFDKTGYSNTEARFFLDYLKEQVKALGYRVQVSDSRTFPKGDWVEVIERHYLKPSPKFNVGEKQDQGFGNIRIELKLRNEKAQLLTFSASTYSDRVYKDAKSFEALITALNQ